MKKIIANCKQATFLIEKRMIGRLTFREYIELRIHLFGCSMCTLYRKQSQIINNIETSPAMLDDRFKQNLQNRIDEGLKK